MAGEQVTAHAAKLAEHEGLHAALAEEPAARAPRLTFEAGMAHERVSRLPAAAGGAG